MGEFIKETQHYGVKVVPKLPDDELTYGIVNKETGVVEHSDDALPYVLMSMLKIEDDLLMAMEAVDKGEVPEIITPDTKLVLPH